MKNILVLEPGVQIYKEPIIQSLAQIPGVNLYFASGLAPHLPIEWIAPYSKGAVIFSYRNSSLHETLNQFLVLKGISLDGILTYVEPSVHIANDLQHIFKLPVISRSRGKILRNKWQMRKLFGAAKIPQPRFFGIASEDAIEKAVKTWSEFPVVVKPAEMMASLGVMLARGPQELKNAIYKAMNADFWDEDLRELYGDITREALIEEYIDGPEYSIETIVHSGNPQILGITKKYSSDTGHFDEIGHRFPAHDLSRETIERIHSVIKASHASLELQNTLTHTELKISQGQPILIEINCRLAGGLISTLMEKSLGISIGNILASTATGKPIDLPPHSQSAYEIHYFHSPIEGRVISVPPDMLNDLMHLEFKSHVKIGDFLFRNDLIGVSRLGHIIRASDPTVNADAVIKDLNSKFQIKSALCFKSIPKTRDQLALFIAGEEEQDDLIMIEQTSWSKSMAADARLIAERIQINPMSTLIAYSLLTGKPLASLVVVPLKDFNPNDVQRWSHYADLAVNKNHVQQVQGAENLYVLSISSVPDAPRGTGSAFVRAALDWFRSHGIARVAYSIRIPNFLAHLKQGVTIDDYYQGLQSGRFHEDIYQLAVRGAGGTPCGVVPEYYNDPDSGNYGITIIHELR